MLQAKPALGWRDVQILIRTARKNAPADADWVVNEPASISTTALAPVS